MPPPTSHQNYCANIVSPSTAKSTLKAKISNPLPSHTISLPCAASSNISPNVASIPSTPALSSFPTSSANKSLFYISMRSNASLNKSTPLPKLASVTVLSSSYFFLAVFASPNSLNSIVIPSTSTAANLLSVAKAAKTAPSSFLLPPPTGSPPILMNEKTP